MTLSRAVDKLIAEALHRIRQFLKPSSPKPLSRRGFGTPRIAPRLAEPQITKVNHPLVEAWLLGFGDGLTVPYALFAALFLLVPRKLLIVSGLVQLAAGAIWYGLVADRCALINKRYFEDVKQRITRAGQENPAIQQQQIYELLKKYGVTQQTSRLLGEELEADEKGRIQFVMDLKLITPNPTSKTPVLQAIVQGLSYFGAGMLHLIPFIAVEDAFLGIICSMPAAITIHLVFGATRARLTGCRKGECFKAALITTLIGATTAYMTFILLYISEVMYSVVQRKEPA